MDPKADLLQTISQNFESTFSRYSTKLKIFERHNSVCEAVKDYLKRREEGKKSMSNNETENGKNSMSKNEETKKGEKSMLNIEETENESSTFKQGDEVELLDETNKHIVGYGDVQAASDSDSDCEYSIGRQISFLNYGRFFVNWVVTASLVLVGSFLGIS